MPHTRGGSNDCQRKVSTARRERIVTPPAASAAAAAHVRQVVCLCAGTADARLVRGPYLVVALSAVSALLGAQDELLMHRRAQDAFAGNPWINGDWVNAKGAQL